MWIALTLFATVAALLICAPAQARARDDVMAGAYRCGEIANDRQWLDCYYGAAQPVRASLSLPPAPPEQLRLAASPPSGGEVRNGNTRGEVMAVAARCYLTADDRQWLNCYYSAAQPLRSLLGLSSNAKAMPTDAPAFAVRKAPPAPNGGFSDWLGGTNNQRIVAQLSSYKFDKYGIFTVTLSNGQVWQQESGDTTYARWKKPAVSYTAIITRGALGSLDLRLQGEPHIYKVSRLQ